MKMENFPTILNGFYMLTIVEKLFILDPGYNPTETTLTGMHFPE